jgi:hypothetical protein
MRDKDPHPVFLVIGHVKQFSLGFFTYEKGDGRRYEAGSGLFTYHVMIPSRSIPILLAEIYIRITKIYAVEVKKQK